MSLSKLRIKRSKCSLYLEINSMIVKNQLGKLCSNFIKKSKINNEYDLKAEKRQKEILIL